jgi:hypothetical protein
MKTGCELNEWGFSSEEWEAIGFRTRYDIKNWQVELFRKELWKRENPEAQREYRRLWRKRNPEKVREQKRRARARRKALKIAEQEHAITEREKMRVTWSEQNRLALARDVAGLSRRLRRVVTARGYPPDVRDDIVSDLMIALLEGDLSINELDTSVTPYAQAHYRGRDWRRTVSFDAPISDSGITLGETIPSDVERF